MSSSPEGLNLDAFASWFGGGPYRAHLIAGGKSNLTYTVSDDRRDFVVRRPPLGHVLATAHDMKREFTIMSALATTAVPVPQMIRFCDDAEIIGAHFYVMEKAEGLAIRRAKELRGRGPQRTRAIAESLTDTLVALHAVDYSAIGLADFGKPEGYLPRQVARWKKQLEASTSRPLKGMDALISSLESFSPVAQDSTIVHGDFRLDNVLVNEADEITAVLDWEMSTLGDPLADVALMASYHQMAVGGGAGLVADAPLAEGYPSVEEVLQRYGEKSGRDLSDMGYYLAFSFFKLAVILEGIYFRHSQGKTVGEGFDGLGDLIVPLINAGRAAFDS